MKTSYSRHFSYEAGIPGGNQNAEALAKGSSPMDEWNNSKGWLRRHFRFGKVVAQRRNLVALKGAQVEESKREAWKPLLTLHSS